LIISFSFLSCQPIIMGSCLYPFYYALSIPHIFSLIICYHIPIIQLLNSIINIFIACIIH
ncbi:hypothetical protein C1646_683764, partial [Rhizophagus diaphanus]